MVDENELYAEWVAAQGYEKDEKLGELIGALKSHARATQVVVTGHADELVSADAVWQAIMKIDQFKGESKFSTWFERIVRNRLKDKHRAKWDERYTPHEDVELDGFEEGSLENPEGAARVKEILEQMTPQEREIVVLVSQGYTEKEIAEKLKISESLVNWRKTRLRERLKCQGQSGQNMALILAL